MQDEGNMEGVTREIVSFARKVIVFDDSLFEGENAKHQSTYEDDNVPVEHYHYKD